MQSLKRLVIQVGRGLEYVLTGESTYRITSSDFKNFDTVGDRFKARMLEDDIRATLARRFSIRLQAPVILELFEDGKAPSPGEDCPAHGVVGFYRPHFLRDERTHLVFVLKDLPRGRFKAVYAHELVHAFERELGILGDQKVLREGLARWVEYKLLMEEGAHREAHKVLNLTRWSWGRGIRLVLALEEQVGEAGVIPSLIEQSPGAAGLSMLFPPPRAFDSIGLGLNSVDHLAIVAEFPMSGSRAPVHLYRQDGGGQVATALCAQATLGLRPLFLGKTGDDDNGRFSRRSLAHHGVDVANVITVAGATTQMAMILVVQSSGERTICWQRGPAIEPGDFDAGLLGQGRYCHIDTHHIESNLHLARLAREQGVPVLMHAEATRPGVDDLLRCCDIILADSAFGARFTGETEPGAILRALQRHSRASMVAMTCGADGSVLLVDGEPVAVPGYVVDVVDTTGAGDVWHGAFGYGLLRDWPPDKICRFANAAAALSCGGLGGRAALPRLEAVQALMQEELDTLPAACQRTNLPADETLDDAWAFAREAHRGQTRDDGVTPYFPHPAGVAQILHDELGVRQTAVLAAALLHDTLEDCPIEHGYFEARFGSDIRSMVLLLTKDGTLSRDEQDRRYFDGLSRASDEVILIKVADRIDNLRQLRYSPKVGKRDRYLTETREKHVPLAARVPAAASLLQTALETV